MAIEMLNTELDAVNLCLSGIGREPVASLDTADLDAAMAKNVLDQISLDLQLNGGQGWWFNREKNWKLSPDNLGRVAVPNNTLSILEARATFYDQGNRLALRGDKVYDTDDHTYDLRNIVDKSGKITFTLLLLLAYENMPPTARSAVAWTARRVFHDDVVGDPQQHQINAMNEQRAYANLEKEHRRASRSNYLKDNDRVRFQIGSIGGHNNLYQ